MNMLTTTEMDSILINKSIDSCTPQEKRQVFAYAFGEEFMASNDKGLKKQY